MARRKTGLGSTLKSATDPESIEKLVQKIHSNSKEQEPPSEEQVIDAPKHPIAKESRGEAPKKVKQKPVDPIVTTSFKLPKSMLKEIKRKAIDEEINLGTYIVSLIEKDLNH